MICSIYFKYFLFGLREKNSQNVLLLNPEFFGRKRGGGRIRQENYFFFETMLVTYN
jgi:hypothetical protein